MLTKPQFQPLRHLLPPETLQTTPLHHLLHLTLTKSTLVNRVISPSRQPTLLRLLHKVNNEQYPSDPKSLRKSLDRSRRVGEMMQAPTHSHDVEIAKSWPVKLGWWLAIREQVALDRARLSYRWDLGGGCQLVEARDHRWGEIEGFDGGYEGAEGTGDHAGAAGVVEQCGTWVFGNADEVEVLLEEVCDLEGHLLLPGVNVVFGGEIVEEGGVCGREVCG